LKRWRCAGTKKKDLEGRKLGGATIRRKLAALSSLFEHLCDANAVTHNPVKGVKRPKVESYDRRKTYSGPQISDHWLRKISGWSEGVE
jgi:integrase/recombinase XerD